MKNKIKSTCEDCEMMGSCCRYGTTVGLEEAKKILKLDLLGEFYNLESDISFKSGYSLSTSINGEPCSFLCSDGKCSIHKISYKYKPKYCKQFPCEDGKLINQSYQLCYKLNKKDK